MGQPSTTHRPVALADTVLEESDGCSYREEWAEYYVCFDYKISKDERDAWLNDFLLKWRSFTDANCIYSFPLDIEVGDEFGMDCSNDVMCYKVASNFAVYYGFKHQIPQCIYGFLCCDWDFCIGRRRHLGKSQAAPPAVTYKNNDRLLGGKCSCEKERIMPVSQPGLFDALYTVLDIEYFTNETPHPNLMDYVSCAPTASPGI